MSYLLRIHLGLWWITVTRVPNHCDPPKTKVNYITLPFWFDCIGTSFKSRQWTPGPWNHLLCQKWKICCWLYRPNHRKYCPNHQANCETSTIRCCMRMFHTWFWATTVTLLSWISMLNILALIWSKQEAIFLHVFFIRNHFKRNLGLQRPEN